jgi:hypothetical protein
MNTHNEGQDWLMDPTPEDWGFPKNPRVDQRNCWLQQERFLEAFRRCGKIGKAAEAVGLTRFAVQRWQRDDVYSFSKRLEAAHADYVEFLETDMDEAITGDPKGKYAMPAAVQRIFRLKAEAPEKYREEVKVINTDAPLRMLEKIRELAVKDAERERQALEGRTVEGEFKELPGREGQNPGGGQ